jgi:phosphoglycolate phosphatase
MFSDWESHGNTGKPKWENLRDLTNRNGLSSPIYVGDTESDRIAALMANTDFIHVAYGFGRTEANRSFSNFRDFVAAVS